MNELAIEGSFDKGTITKSIQKLEQLEYVTLETSSEDKRSKLLYTTEKAHKILPDLYVERQKWFNYIASDLTEEEKDAYVKTTNKLLLKAKAYNETHLEDVGVKIYGLQKLSMLDYPGHMAATIFTGGCNFRCPFCHNRSLVFLDEADKEIEVEEVIDYLEKRKGILDGVCVTGGEALLQPGIKQFIKSIKGLGLDVKLDTNGTNSKLLKELIDEKLIDYVAMDIKNSKKKYPLTTGQEDVNLKEIESSVELLKNGTLDYEFRTTVVKEYHEEKDFEDIGEWIKGANHYYIQNFEDHGNCIEQGLNPHTKEKLEIFKDIASKYVKDVGLRGIKE